MIQVSKYLILGILIPSFLFLWITPTCDTRMMIQGSAYLILEILIRSFFFCGLLLHVLHVWWFKDQNIWSSRNHYCPYFLWLTPTCATRMMLRVSKYLILEISIPSFFFLFVDYSYMCYTHGGLRIRIFDPREINNFFFLADYNPTCATRMMIQVSKYLIVEILIPSSFGILLHVRHVWWSKDKNIWSLWVQYLVFFLVGILLHVMHAWCLKDQNISSLRYWSLRFFFFGLLLHMLHVWWFRDQNIWSLRVQYLVFFSCWTTPTCAARMMLKGSKNQNIWSLRYWSLRFFFLDYSYMCYTYDDPRIRIFHPWDIDPFVFFFFLEYS